MPSALPTDLLNRERVRSILAALRRHLLQDDLAALLAETDLEPIDWSFALTVASALCRSNGGSGREQEAVLRICHGCLTLSGPTDAHRIAAITLLERLGNQRAVDLAEEKEVVPTEAWSLAPVPLQLDVIRRRLELGIPLTDGRTLAANQFQREFWTEASRNLWLSVSAPTSAGKSYILKQWFAEQVATTDHYRAVYLVPTRALIEEVSSELRAHFGGSVRVHVLPWGDGIGTSHFELYVMTQERLHLLYQRLPDLHIDTLFIDEAQKFNDGARGVLLQRVLDDTVRRNPSAKVMFASPMAANPEILLEGAPPNVTTHALHSESITVTQNLLWVNQVRGRTDRWIADLISAEGDQPAGEFVLWEKPTPASKRLPYVAVALGDKVGGNVIYVDEPGKAETAARQIYDLLGADRNTRSPRIAEARELIEFSIHPNYELARVLQRGVAFHYGSMPLLVRTAVERLFRDGEIEYLVCTSTLLEGVNLPCRNLFARAPKKGRGHPMTSGDFWNLAGRAGRWGSEFQGNIVCVDTAVQGLWDEAPRERVARPLTRATDTLVDRIRDLRSYLESGDATSCANWPEMPPLLNLLITRSHAGAAFADLPGFDKAPPGELAALADDIETLLSTLETPISIVRRHADISPLAMDQALVHFRASDRPDLMVVVPPEDPNAWVSYRDALGLSDELLGSRFGNEARRNQLGVLAIQWMSGMPLSQIISGRIQYEARKAKPRSDARVIRDVMSDVENEARFNVPRYLACYIDVLATHLVEVGKAELARQMPDLSKLLELGISSQTGFGFIELGLSRTAAIALAEIVSASNLTAAECREWLRNNDITGLDLPKLVRDEIAALVQITT